MRKILNIMVILAGAFFIYNHTALAQAVPPDSSLCPEGDKDCINFKSGGSNVTATGASLDGDCCGMLKTPGLIGETKNIYRGGSGSESSSGSTRPSQGSGQK